MCAIKQNKKLLFLISKPNLEFLNKRKRPNWNTGWKQRCPGVLKDAQTQCNLSNKVPTIRSVDMKNN